MARSKKIKLPFLVEPKREPIKEVLGNEESGQIEIIRRGYLTVSEKSFVQQGIGADSSLIAMQRLAGRVAKRSGRQVQEVLLELTTGDFGDPGLEGMETELEAVMTGLAGAEPRQKILAATCMLIYRVTDQWTVEDTLNLHPDLIDELYLLYKEEDARSLEAFEEVSSQVAKKENPGK